MPEAMLPVSTRSSELPHWGLEVCRGTLWTQLIVRNRLALLFGCLDRGLLNFIHAAVKFSFKLILRFPELSHAAAEAAGKGGELFGAKKDENENGNDHHFWRAERSKGNDGGVHNGNGYC